nr:hypothetical protein CFP56_02869 [Quercus suber]
MSVPRQMRLLRVSPSSGQAFLRMSLSWLRFCSHSREIGSALLLVSFVCSPSSYLSCALSSRCSMTGSCSNRVCGLNGSPRTSCTARPTSRMVFVMPMQESISPTIDKVSALDILTSQARGPPCAR